MKYKDFKNFLYSTYWVSYSIIDMIVWNELFLEREKVFLLSNFDGRKKNKIESKIKKYASGYPIQYLLWKSEFMWFEFIINNNVLIPRDDTEILVNNALNVIEEEKNRVILIDLWTGSWIIPIMLNKLSWNIKKTYCFDISRKALKIAEKNINFHNIKKIKTINKSFTTLKNCFKNEDFSWETLIFTANLPYIKKLDFENMDYSVYTYEPRLALYWWEKTWFELYEKLIFLLKKIKSEFCLKKSLLFIEIWFDQKEIAFDFLKNVWLSFEYFVDTNNIARVIKITF